MLWTRGQLIWIESDQSSGPALIVGDHDPQFFTVRFLESQEKRNYTRRNPPFKRVEFFEGLKVLVRGLEQEITVSQLEMSRGLYSFAGPSGRLSEAEVVHISTRSGVLDLLRHKKESPPKIFHLRRRAWELYHQRNTHPFRGAAGCRVQLLPHQVWVLDAALKMPRIRALLADEVGLGKTIEAGLIFSALHAQKRLQRVLILVPNALKVQWLTECFRRFNVRFRLDHEELIEADEHRDFVISSLDEIDAHRGDLDLLIVDEAHRLFHDEARAEKLSALVQKSEHVLFLSATPRVHGHREFERMMRSLATSSEGTLKAKVFRSRRSELGIPCYRQLEATMTKNKEAWLLDFLREKLSAAPREKVFLITHSADEVRRLHKILIDKLGQHFALFHEDMDLVERDRQAAYFADPEGAPFLLSSEIGGEGRNFQFCHEMVLLDLPADPLVVEQRIGRLDRLGQSKRVTVWCPVAEDTDDEDRFQKHRDVYQVFEKPWSGSGLEDLAESDLLKQPHSDANPPLSGEDFEEVRFDGQLAATLLNQVEELGLVEVKNFLDQLYDLFGVEVEDFDTRGNWRVAASSLMFVEYFPGLGESGERVLTFDRDQSLAREDMTLFTLDHPEFMESIEFLLNTDHGKVAFAPLPDGTPSDVLFWYLHTSEEDSVEVLWSFRQKRSLPLGDRFRASSAAAKVDSLPAPFFESLSQACQSYVAQQSLPAESLDAVLVFIPQNQ